MCVNMGGDNPQLKSIDKKGNVARENKSSPGCGSGTDLCQDVLNLLKGTSTASPLTSQIASAHRHGAGGNRRGEIIVNLYFLWGI
jgi:hypothetical protein